MVVSVFSDLLSGSFSAAYRIVWVMLAVLLNTPLIFADTCVWPGRAIQGSIIPVAADDGSYASGIVIAPNRVLTAAHVVASSHNAFVAVDYDFMLARVLRIDEEKDLAVMVVDTSDILPISLSHRELSVNQAVWAIGYPNARSKTTSVGRFKTKRNGALHTSAHIDAGESGGGLISCENGKFVLAGMLRGYGAYVNGHTTIKIQNHSVSVTARDINNFVSLD